MTPPTSDARGQTGAMALTIALWLLLADAAVETFLSGASVRWWVAAAVAAFLALMAGLAWRHRTSAIVWSRFATASLIGLLALLAATAWLPDGLTNGVVMLRQPTPVVLSAVSALAVAAAGLTLARAPFLPWWGRAVLGLLAVYGVAAFAVGIIEATAYSTLFQGGSLWQRLPSWLQGAFVAATIVLPIGITASLMRAFAKTMRKDGGLTGAREVVALTLSITIITSGFVRVPEPPRTVRDRQPAGDGLFSDGSGPVPNRLAELGGPALDDRDTGSDSREAAAQELDRLLGILDTEERRQLPEAFDPRHLVTMSGGDVPTLFNWVRDNTQLVPYRGVLRGSTGVLLDRVGNSLDRSLLLYSTLKAADQRVRLARGTMAQPQIRQVLRAIESSPIRQPLHSDALGKTEKDYVRILSDLKISDPTAFLRYREKLTRDHQVLKASVHRDVSNHAALLSAAMDHAGDIQQSVAGESLRDHWWVQWYKDSTWVNLDTSLASAEVGHHLATPEETFQPESPADLPVDLQHSLTIRVLIEQAKDGVLNQHNVLEHTIRPSELYGVPVIFMNYPTNWPEDLRLLLPPDTAGRLKDAVIAQQEWLPILRLGSQVVFQSGFTISGDVNANPMAPLSGGTALGGRLGGILSSGEIGATDRPGSTDSGQLTGEWIEYSISAPGGPERTARRVIFDSIGPAGRAAARHRPPNGRASAEARLALAGQIEILPVSAQPSAAFVEHVLTSNLVANRGAITSLVRGAAADTMDDLSEHAATIVSQPFHLYALAFLRGNWSPFQGDVYLDRTNVLTYRKHFVAGAEGDLRLLTGFDIVANELAVRPGAENDHFETRIRLGVLDTHLEAVLAASACEGDGQECGSMRNAAQAFGRDARAGATWTTVRTVSDEAWVRIRLPEDIKAGIEQDLRRGYAVVVPNRPMDDGTVSWWRIDPHLGHTLGIGDQGWGQTASERVGIYTVALGMMWFWYCTARAIQNPSNPGKSAMDFVKCNFDFICILVALAVGLETGSPYIAATITAACRVIKLEMPASF